MLTLKQIREDKAFTLERLAVKGVDATEAVEKIEALDDERKSIQANRAKRRRPKPLRRKRFS